MTFDVGQNLAFLGLLFLLLKYLLPVILFVLIIAGVFFLVRSALKEVSLQQDIWILLIAAALLFAILAIK